MCDMIFIIKQKNILINEIKNIEQAINDCKEDRKITTDECELLNYDIESIRLNDLLNEKQSNIIKIKNKIKIFDEIETYYPNYFTKKEFENIYNMLISEKRISICEIVKMKEHNNSFLFGDK
jgi:hypothetical protein